MPRRLLLITAAAALTAASNLAFAQSPNDGPKYPNMESHKQYKDVRNLDHNNPSPRYAATTANKQYKDVRNLDHNNPSPRYTATSTASTRQRASMNRKTRYTVHALHRSAANGNHG